jgi:hypothetical protein
MLVGGIIIKKGKTKKKKGPRKLSSFQMGDS